MSKVAGRIAAQEGAKYLGKCAKDWCGVILGGVKGVFLLPRSLSWAEKKP